MRKMIATMMLLFAINISNVAADEQEKSSKPTRIEMDKSKFFGDEIWKFQLLLRKTEYFHNRQGIRRLLCYPLYVAAKFRLNHRQLKLGFSIPLNVFGPGLSIPHYGTIVVANRAVIGKNCRIHEGVTIGATNGSSGAARIGDDVFISSGVKIIGEVTIADRVAIGANAVVVKSIEEPGTTWGGVPAKKISDHSSGLNQNLSLQ